MAPLIVRAEGIMRLTVFGATGGIGTDVVRQALARSHEVIAVVRDPARLAVPPAATLTVVTADVMDPSAIKPALDGADAVASALGPRSGGPPNVLTESMHAILSAMDATGVRRLIAVSASGFFVEPGEGFLTGKIAKPLLRRILRDNAADTRRMEQLITASPTDWTILRPSQLTNAPRKPYKTAVDRYVGPRIARADVADAILNALEDPATITHRVNLGY
jgi:putative NADH-flavin reductase